MVNLKLLSLAITTAIIPPALAAAPEAAAALLIDILNKDPWYCKLPFFCKTLKDPKPKDPWPKIDVKASYETINATRLRDAVQCLRNFCERREDLAKDGGKARCYTRHLDGGDVAAWVCNPSHAPMVCTSRLIDFVLQSQVEETGKQGALYSGGMTWYSADKHHHLLFGFDSFCSGNSGDMCGKYRDTVHFCDDVIDMGGDWKKNFLNGDVEPKAVYRLRSPVQFEDWNNGFESKGFNSTPIIVNGPEGYNNGPYMV
ncbi:hypothetical protein QBC38DRAFT_472867 [Podospora fimiseda]|uniref:Ecp2 effector protein domain-containing protein n=1 Tax=Podospora fimiseda TaxID=252190 RepID=A0AAN7H2N0_9PEZI|nr:hypothetical protein QBC38DRAFT_472867 [Podospora fimiseda]